jgi:hypothetical protein
MRNNFLKQPYPVGSKNSKSLAVVIPSEIVKKNKIDTSTVFALKCIKTGILFSYVSIDRNENELTPVDNNSSQATNSTGIHY